MIDNLKKFLNGTFQCLFDSFASQLTENYSELYYKLSFLISKRGKSNATIVKKHLFGLDDNALSNWMPVHRGCRC